MDELLSFMYQNVNQKFIFIAKKSRANVFLQETSIVQIHDFLSPHEMDIVKNVTR
jgi:hypothetical protein